MIRTKKFIKDTDFSTVQESGTAEIEGAIGAHENVAEAAVVGYTHEIKGQGIYAYVTIMTGSDINKNSNLISEIKFVHSLFESHPISIWFIWYLEKFEIFIA